MLFFEMSTFIYTQLKKKKNYNVLLFVLLKRDIMVNLYKLYFQSNQKVFHPFTFSPFQPNTNGEN